MAQVQTPREFKFVGGPSRKRRRNGTAPIAASTDTTTAPSSTSSSKQAKRSCVPATGVRSPPSTSSATSESAAAIHRPLPSSPLPLYDVDMLSASPRSVFSRMPIGGDDGEGIHPDITNTIAATLAGLASSGDSGHAHGHGLTTSLPHHSSSPESTGSSCESTHNPISTVPIGSAGNNSHSHSHSNRYGNNTPTPGLEGILDWPTEEFMNPFFPAVSLDAAMFGGGSANNAAASGMMDAGAVQSTPTMMLPLPSPSPPQMSSLPSLGPPSHPATTLADDVEELPSHLDTLSAIQLPSPLSAFCFDTGANSNNLNTNNDKQAQTQEQQHMMTIPADALLMATSPRMYAQPSILYDTISRIFFQCKSPPLHLFFLPHVS